MYPCPSTPCRGHSRATAEPYWRAVPDKTGSSPSAARPRRRSIAHTVGWSRNIRCRMSCDSVAWLPAGVQTHLGFGGIVVDRLHIVPRNGRSSRRGVSSVMFFLSFCGFFFIFIILPHFYPVENTSPPVLRIGYGFFRQKLHFSYCISPPLYITIKDSRKLT